MLARTSQRILLTSSNYTESRIVTARLSTPYEQLQNGQAELSINSLMTLAWSVMVESGLGGQYWFSAAMAAKDAHNVWYKEHIRMIPYLYMYERKKDTSKFRAFGCQGSMYLNEERRGKGKHTPRAVEAINLGFATDHNISGYKLYIPSKLKIEISNEVQFDELRFQNCKQAIIDQNYEDTQANILSRVLPGPRGFHMINHLQLGSIRRSIMTQKVMC
jgi:hypothetical protein